MFRPPSWIAVFLLVHLPVAPSWAEGQVPAQEGPLPPEVQERVLAFVNAPSTVRLPGGSRIPAGTLVEGDVAVLGGSATVGGAVTGLLVVVNGDLTFRPGARVGGDVLVVGGLTENVEEAHVEGSVAVYRGPLRYRIRGGRVEGVREEGLTPGFLESDFGFGHSRVTLRAGPNYNRVEGLPVHIGPLVETRGRNPLRLEAFGIWRSVSGLNLETDRLGYSFRLEQALGGRGTVFLGATAHSEVVPIEERGMTNLEASLSTFLLRRDIRDYYEREGWSTYLELRPGRLPLRATLRYREEDHAFAAIRNPWTLRSGDEPWRPQPLAAEGPYRGVEVDLFWDSRDDPVMPADGWWTHLLFQRQVGGALAIPLEEVPGTQPLFTAASLDLRRYARVGPTTRLLLRGAVGGSLGSSPLPSQFQRALGGEGTLPGHRRFSVDCGARQAPRVVAAREGDPDEPDAVFPAYGCDRTALFQAELQGELPFSWNPVPEDWETAEWASFLELRPRWAAFFNAGQGWLAGEPDTAFRLEDSPTRADVGVGLFVGPMGLYWSYALNRRERGLNFFVRLQQRF